MKIFLNGENMRVKEFDRGVILEDAENFNLNHVFDCGQCFRWIKQPDGGYIGVAKEKVIKIISSNNNITIFNTNLQEFFEIWENYFDLKADYRSYQERLSFDETMKKAISGKVEMVLFLLSPCQLKADIPLRRGGCERRVILLRAFPGLAGRLPARPAFCWSRSLRQWACR